MVTVDLEQARFWFRRQFVLGPRPFAPTPDWRHEELAPSWILSPHPDLKVTRATIAGFDGIVLGILIDPQHPLDSPEGVLSRCVRSAYQLPDLLHSFFHVSGRWVVLCRHPDGIALFHDACGLRQILYAWSSKELWCGSEPEVIKADVPLNPEKDPELLEIVRTAAYENNERAWVGDRTPYQDCRHLLPNHYLDCATGTAHRYFPSNGPRPAPTEVVAAACDILEATIRGVVEHWPATLAVTAGQDSRILLAASRPLRDRIEYFVDRLGALPAGHPDIAIPSQIAERPGLNFHIRNSSENPSAGFLRFLENNTTRARNLPKPRPVWQAFQLNHRSINLCGNGSEIARNFFDPYGR